jgi:hypothetical protein
MSSLRPEKHLRRRLGLSVLLCVLGLGPAAVLLSSRAWAAPSQLKTPAQRSVAGTVVNGSGQPMDKVVVYLQDQKTQVIRSYVTVNGGQFHFNQLSPDTDYEVWAEVNKNSSKRKFISMFNSHVKFTYKLKIKS